MWTEAGIAVLIASFPPPGCVIGLYAGDDQRELAATRGLYRRQPLAGAPWQSTEVAGVTLLTGPETVFTGFVGHAPASGFLVLRDDVVLFWAPFLDGIARPVVAEVDQLRVIPYLTLKAIH